MKKAMTWLRVGVLMAMVLALVVWVLYRCNVFVFDDSAVGSGNGIEWNGARYVPCDGQYETDSAFAKMAGDDARVLYAVQGDDSHRFLVAKAMRDPQLYVREDIAVPTDGLISTVYVGTEPITDLYFLSMCNEIFSEEMPLCDEEILFKDAKSVFDIWFSFNGCPVAVVNEGKIVSGDTWYAVRYVDGQCHAVPLTDEQIETIKSFVESSPMGRMMWIAAVLAAVATIVILGRKKSKGNVEFHGIG